MTRLEDESEIGASGIIEYYQATDIGRQQDG
jgi:hypothetical protein